MKYLPGLVAELLAAQHGLVTRAQALDAGMSDDRLTLLVREGVLERTHPGVYRGAGRRQTAEERILAACLAAGPEAVGSHRSAAYLWGLLDADAATPTITVPRSCHPRLRNVTVHRSTDIGRSGVVAWRGIPCTNPLRALVDLAGRCDDAALDRAVDVGLARRLVTVEGLVAEVVRLSTPGRRGASALRSALQRRGHLGAPSPSVLESATLRLLHRNGIRPLGTEHRMLGGTYRVDVLLAEGVAMEVDGYAWHSSPEQHRSDLRRANALDLTGLRVVRFTWYDILHDGQAVVAQVRRAVAAAPSTGNSQGCGAG